jgi:hypothetical protein
VSLHVFSDTGRCRRRRQARAIWAAEASHIGTSRTRMSDANTQRVLRPIAIHDGSLLCARVASVLRTPTSGSAACSLQVCERRARLPNGRRSMRTRETKRGGPCNSDQLKTDEREKLYASPTLDARFRVLAATAMATMSQTRQAPQRWRSWAHRAKAERGRPSRKQRQRVQSTRRQFRSVSLVLRS